MTYFDKKDLYLTNNIIAQSFNALCYKNNPKFMSFIKTHGADYRFKDVKIEYASKTTLIWQTGSGVLMPTASLDYKGDSQCSYVVLAENKLLSALSPTIFTSTKNMASAVEGYVLVPKT